MVAQPFGENIHTVTSAEESAGSATVRILKSIDHTTRLKLVAAGINRYGKRVEVVVQTQGYNVYLGKDISNVNFAIWTGDLPLPPPTYIYVTVFNPIANDLITAHCIVEHGRGRS
jgi:hypothetical protein